VNDDDEFLIAGDDGRAITSPAGTARLVELAEVLAACRMSFFETAGSFHWDPQPGSAANLVATALPSPDPLLKTLRPETGHRLITESVQTHLQTAAGLMGALGVLFEAGEVFAAPGTLVRGALESVARVFWIIGDGTDHPEQLLARAYLEEFLSAEGAKMAASRMGGKESEPYIERARMWLELRAEILYRFPGATKLDLAEEGGRELAGERLISPSGGVTSMFEFLERQAGSTITERMALGMYDFLSNSTHPTLYPSRQRRLWVEHPSHPGEHVALEKVELAFVRKQAAVAVVAYYNALTYVTSYFGWSTSVCDTLTARIDKSLPGTLKDA
jgi:hypothetical protein